MEQPELRPEDINLNLERVSFDAENSYSFLQLLGFVRRINKNLRARGETEFEEPTNRRTAIQLIKSYFEERESSKTQESEAESEDQLYETIKSLIEINGFNRGFFIDKCEQSERSTGKCKQIFNEGLRQHLHKPILKDESLADAADDYLDSIFLPLFSSSAKETQIYDKKKEQILKLVNTFDEDLDIDKFWQDYCHNYLEFEVDTNLAKSHINILNEAWNRGDYLQLETVQYLAENEPNYYSTVPEVFSSERKFGRIQPKDPLKWLNLIIDLYPRAQLPQFETGNESQLVLRKNISLALNFCFQETYYPTPEGLITIPYNGALARIAFGYIKTEKSFSENEIEILRKAFIATIHNIDITLCDYLYTNL